MTNHEDAVLKALIAMADQYLTVEGQLDSLSMSAGQKALSVLARAGLVDYDGSRCGHWTEAGLAMLSQR